MVPEIIPKAKPRINHDTLTVTWMCPGCEAENLLYTFSETLKTLKQEIKSVDRVSCLTCTKKFEID